MADKLSPEEIMDWMNARTGWKGQGDGIRKRYVFPSFRSTIVFVNRIATIADELNHHPDIDVRYDKVYLTLTTHDAGGVTRKDLELANRIDLATSVR